MAFIVAPHCEEVEVEEKVRKQRKRCVRNVYWMNPCEKEGDLAGGSPESYLIKSRGLSVYFELAPDIGIVPQVHVFDYFFRTLAFHHDPLLTLPYKFHGPRIT